MKPQNQTSTNSRPKLLLGIAGAAIVVAAVLIWHPWSPRPTSEPTKLGPKEEIVVKNEEKPKESAKVGQTSDELPVLVQPKQPSKEIDKQMTEIYVLHIQRDWKEAAKRWKGLSELPDLSPKQLEESVRNLRTCEAMDNDPVSAWTRAKEDEEGKPTTKIPKKSFLEGYPEDRRVRSLAFFDLTGNGTNTWWIFKGRVHFAYQLRVVTLTKVISNDGTVAKCELQFEHVSQERVISEIDSFQIEIPDSVQLKAFLTWLDSIQVAKHPIYRTARGLGVLAQLADPRLEKSLTYFAKQLKINGADLSDKATVEFAAQLEQLSGQRMEVEYVRDVGITQVKMLDGQVLPQQTLRSLAHYSSLLMDHYIFPNVAQPPGTTWTVDAQDVATLFNGGYQASAHGELFVGREEDETIQNEVLAKLALREGSEVRLGFEEDGESFEGKLIPDTASTVILYSPQDLLIREARLHGKARLSRFSKQHLLFRTTGVNDLQFKVFYQGTNLNKAPLKGPGKAQPKKER